MTFYRNGSAVATYSNEYQGKKIVVGIDSSKSNSAIVVGDAMGNVYNDYEINGSGSDNNVYVVAYETRKAVRTLLDGADILAVGIEDIITKKYKKPGEERYEFSEGIKLHKSRAMITHIFDSFIIMFMDYFGIMPILVPNSSWKSAVIPAEFNKHGQKGAKLYYDTVFPKSRWASRKDDVTDAYGVYQYVLMKKNFSVSYTLDAPKLCKGQVDWGLFSNQTISQIKDSSRKFDFNESLSLEQIANSLAANMMATDSYVYCIVPIEYVDVKYIYSEHLMDKFPKGVKELALVVAK